MVRRPTSHGSWRHGYALAVTVAFALSHGSFRSVNGAEGGGEAGIPEKLQAWASDKYTTRYFLRVEAPPAAGALGIQPEPQIASLYLPLRIFPQGIEPLLLLGDNGQPLSLFVRPVKGGNEVEVAFPTGLARRRFCLYAGAPEGKATRVSPLDFKPRAVTVIVRGYSAPNLQSGGKPVDLARWQELPRIGRSLGDAHCRNLDDPDPPFREQAGRRGGLDPWEAVLRDPHYAAVYEALLRAPVNGSYGFAVTTFGAASLQVDGKEVLCAGAADADRAPFALTGQAQLLAGIHRVVLYHAQCGGKTGVRLCWRLPGQQDLVAVPGQAFPRALPTVVTGVEDRNGPLPFLHLELVGHYRTGRHGGEKTVQQWQYILAQGAGKPARGTVRCSAPGAAPSEAPAGGACFRVPAGEVALFEWRDGERLLAQRAVRFPKGLLAPENEEEGARDVFDLTGELAVKAAPHFLYPDETAQFHLEAQLSPLAKLVPKERLHSGPPLPEPQPAGQFRVRWRLLGLPEGAAEKPGVAGEVEATPDATGRRKVRLPLDLTPLETALSERALRLEIRLSIGGLPADARVYRLLHARAAWPGTLRALPAGLEFVPDRAEDVGKFGDRQDVLSVPEFALVVVPREEEADYRRFRPPVLTSPRSTSSAEALFLGDPLVEPPAGAPANVPVGLAARVAQALPEKEWTHVLLPGPHRDLFIFRLLAAAETHLRGRPGGRISGLVLVSLGLGDAARQTPGYDFERGLDVLVDRLRRAGAERIFFLGVLPEPGRMRQAEGYQAKVLDVIRQQHLEGLDLFTPWTKEQDWERRFRLESESPTPAYGPVPNAAALDEITEQLKARLK